MGVSKTQTSKTQTSKTQTLKNADHRPRSRKRVGNPQRAVILEILSKLNKSINKLEPVPVKFLALLNFLVPIKNKGMKLLN